MYRLINYRLISIPVSFKLSWGKPGYSRRVFVWLRDNSGKTGAGEGVLYKTTHLKLLPFLEKGFSLEPERLVSFEPGLAFAVDTAIRDIQSKIVKPDYNYPVVREIFLEEKNLQKKVKEYVAKGTKTIKLKVGAGIKKDKEAIEFVNKYSQGKLKINLDANRGYSLRQGLELAQWGKKNNVVLFEEPIKGSFSELKKFKDGSGLFVMLDESVQTIAALDEAVAARCFDILNVKLTRLGGITIAQKYIRKCQSAGIKIYLGCSEELDQGTAAIFSLAKSIKNLYDIEGFGKERLENLKAQTYEPGKSNREFFLAKEFLGVWQTRVENLFINAKIL